MARYYNPSKRLSEWAAALLSPYIKLENDGGAAAAGGSGGSVQDNASHDTNTPPSSSSSQALSVGLWSGFVELKNVELRPEALEQFLNRGDGDDDDDGHRDHSSGDYTTKIRWKLIRGSIDTVKIQIPWKSILVGSIYSASKPSGEGITLHQGEDDDNIQNEVVPSNTPGESGEDDAALSSQTGCTTIHIQGVNLRLGYEVIHSDPLLNTWQQRQQQHESKNLSESYSSEGLLSPLEDQLREKIREEKNRILQIAERRLRAGVDPFPPSLMDGLNSLTSSSVVKSGIHNPVQPEATSNPMTYLSRVENYLSSTIKSLIWRLFGSLSLSVVQVQISVVGQSHYDKYPIGGAPGPGGNKKRRRSQHPEGHRNETRRSSDGTALDHGNDGRNYLNRCSSDVQEGEVEVGVTLNRLDVRPEALSNPRNSIQSESVAKKHIAFRGVGVFVRRAPAMTGVGGTVKDDVAGGIEVLWNGSVNEDDYVVLPVDISASCKVYRHYSGISPNKEGIFSDAAGTSTGSDATISTRRRGKRDKAQKVSVGIRPSTSVANGTLPMKNTMSKQQCLDSVSNATSKATTNADFSPRLEIKVSVGHVRSSFSPRQIFLLHSLSTSMKRIKNGRPITTIRAAKVSDKKLYARMAEEGQCVMAWDDHIYRAVPSLRSCFSSRRTIRSLPRVTSFWWKYAYVNVVSEINHRKRLLGMCGERNRSRSILSRTAHSDQTCSLAKQNRIREEYIHLYLSSRNTTAAPTEEATLTDVNSRLEKIEDQMSVEQILLLRNVACAAAIHRASSESAPGQGADHSSSSNMMYHTFSPNSHANEVENMSTPQHPLGLPTDGSLNSQKLERRDDPTKSHATDSIIGVAEKRYADACSSHNTIDSTSESQPKSVLSFSAKVFVAGFSLAICDFSSDSSMKDAQASDADQCDQITSDDISALTGFSDDDSKTPIQLSAGDTSFDPLHRFWPATRHGWDCSLIMLMHVVDVAFSVRSQEDDDINRIHVKSEFSLGGVSVMSGHGHKEQTILCVGCIPCAKPRRGVGKDSIGVSGRLFDSSYSINICSAEVKVDWGWLDIMQRFASTNKDIIPLRALATQPPRHRGSIYSGNNLSRKNSFRSLGIGEMSLTAPLAAVSVTNASNEEQLLVATTKHVHITRGINCDGSPMRSGEIVISPAFVSEVQSSLCSPTGEDLIFVIDGFDAVLVTMNNDFPTAAKTITRLLRCPSSIQLRHCGGPVLTPRIQPTSSFQSYHVTIPSLQILLSELRLRSILQILDSLTFIFDNSDDTAEYPTQASSTSENVLADTTVSIQSFGVYLIPDNADECSVEASSSRDRLEHAVYSFITHLSCMDFEQPCQVAVACMSRELLDKLSDLGVSDRKARECVQSATLNFKKEAGIRLYADSLHPARIGSMSAKALHDMSPEILSNRLDQIVRSATLMTISEYGDCLPPRSICQLALDAELLSVSIPDGGKALQISVKSICVRSGQVNLLHVHQNGNDENVPSASNDNEAALAVFVRNSSTGYHEISFQAGCVESVFNPDAYLDAVNACADSVRALMSYDGSCCGSSRRRQKSAMIGVVDGKAASFTLVLTDNLIPFIECRFRHVVLEEAAIGSRNETPISLHAGSVSLDCVCTSTYPNIISTYSATEGQTVHENYAFRLTAHRVHESNYRDIKVDLNGVRITLLRQLLNDVLQYFSSPNYGFGLLLSGLGFEEENDYSSPVPSRPSLTINNSSIILPRDSTSVDMVGIEVEEISLTHEHVADSWSIDDCSFLNDIADPFQGKRQSATSAGSEFFYECINDETFNKTSALIPRFAVRVRNAHIFTSHSKRQFYPRYVHMPSFLASVRITGRAEHGKSPFSVCGEMNASMAEDITSRPWETVTRQPLNLGIKLDYAPKPRLLIEDIGHGISPDVSVSMRMSQFYLLMSVWFANNNELPVLFPYEIDVSENKSSDPSTPPDWPEYGTSEFVEWLKRGMAETAIYEMAICLTNLSWQCMFDRRDYFAHVPLSMSMMQPQGDYSEDVASRNFISVALENAVCRITLDKDSLQRIAIGATSIHVLDGRQSEFAFEKGIFTERHDGRSSSVDLNWGIDCGYHTLFQGLPIPFQTTVVLTPDMRCMVNLGVDMAEAALVDLSPIWILLDYFGLYFKESEYGNPAFDSELLRENVGASEVNFSNNVGDGYRSIDFRLWLINPNLIIPSSSASCIMLEAGGLFYRYMSVGESYSSQEIVANNLGVIVMSEFMDPSLRRGLRHISGSLSSCGVKTLVDEMSFSLRYDFNASSDYTRITLRVPLSPHDVVRCSMDGIECLDSVVQPFCVPSPSVCKPFVVPTRDMGPREGSIFFSYEYMKFALELLIAFPGPFPQDEPSRVSGNDNQFSIAAHVEGVNCVLCDPVMGMHRPFLSVCLASLFLNTSQFQDSQQLPREEMTGFQLSMETTLFVDYFKLGLTRNWEPLVEPFKCLVLYEKCTDRGKGITFNADCPLHVNVTSAVIETIDDAVKTFERSWEGSVKEIHPKRCSLDSEVVKNASVIDRVNNLVFHHRLAEQLHENERVAFSLKNSTGDRVRVHAHSAPETEKTLSATILYLDHSHLMPLSFPATMTSINNLQSLELPFKGDQNIASNHQRVNAVIDLEIDLQVPGFRWVRKISFDKPGKHFVQLNPRSPVVLAKVREDWRLRNALQILTEVTSVNGGRRLSIKSPFEIINKTDHPLFVASDPDPRHSPMYNGELDSVSPGGERHSETNFTIEKIYPDDTLHISFLLLESALHINGNHLGCIWIRPDQAAGNDFKDDGTLTIGFPSRPIQLAKILHESSVIFKDSDCDPIVANQVASGIEVSCPTFDGKCRSSRPFCYVVEVKKSPFSKITETGSQDIAGDEMTPGRMGKGLKSAKNIFSRANAPEKKDIHAPIAYSLVIHPPLILENLLPERARFELMHASTKNVLWWGCLEAGERFSVYTVGLDAPILLLVNLGFCKTAIGEGALIHHGGGAGHFKVGWNTIQGAMKTSKDRVKKTLTTITESKDYRGAKRVAMVKAGRNAAQKAGSRKVGQLGSSSENDNIESSGDSFPRRGDGFGVEDIASELCLIDSLGQRLTLHIDNILGSGGQRHVTIYSPFWIVNTTEHSLRYRQEKSVQYVAGTVLSPEKDGSKPVDGGYRSRVDEEDYLISESYLGPLDTIFSGQPGALSLVKRNSDCRTVKPEIIAALISNDLPLHVLSKLAFMFNFHDVISLGGSPRLCIQLADTTVERSHYTSDWSSGFGLESIGVTQIVGMHCKDGRGLEVAVSVSIASGRLSNYTKIVRICPRYVVVNQLARPIRLWQDSSILHPNLPVENSSSDVTEQHKWVFADTRRRSHGIINQYELLFGSPTLIRCEDESGMESHTTAHRDACYIATIRPSELVAFHLPDTRLERSLRVDLGPCWYLSSSFAADVPGEYLLTINPAKDLRMLPPVSTRGAPVYTVSIPSTDQTDNWGGELGVWFETEPWGRERSLIVKGVKPGSYASNWTDIAVGDEMVMIDSTPVDTLTFDEAMTYMKSRLAAAKGVRDISSANQSPRPSQFQLMLSKKKKRSQRSHQSMSTDNGVTLTFLTQEEQLRRLRRAAVAKYDPKPYDQNSNISAVLKSEMVHEIDHTSTSNQAAFADEVLVEMKCLFQSVFVFLRVPDPADPPHRVINRSLHWRIYYRQRSCDSHPWRCLAPGESAAYTWEEPMKAKKLSVRVGIGDWNEDEMNRRDGATSESIDETYRKSSLRSTMPYFSYQFIRNEEAGYFGTTKTVKLDEIGYMDMLPCPKESDSRYEASGLRKERCLVCQVDTDGSTRVLIVSDDLIGAQVTDETVVRRHLANIKREIKELAKIRNELSVLKEAIALMTISPNDGTQIFVGNDSLTVPSAISESTGGPSDYTAAEIRCSHVNIAAIENELHELVDYDEDRFITKRNQVIVEVLEATGLRSSDLNGLSNPYAKVGLLFATKKRRVGSFATKLTRTTYYVPKTLSPQWSDQSFVFDVPERASDHGEFRRVSIVCVVKSAEIGKNKFLGQAYIHLRNIKDQKEHVGWYPLVGNVGQSGISKDPLEKIRGSIRLRVQWIYDTPGLLDYYLLCTERRLGTLQRRNDGMKRQLKSIQAASQQVREQEESFVIARAPALALLHKRKKSVYVDPTALGASEENASQASKGMRVMSAKDKLVKTFHAARFMGRIKRLSDEDCKMRSTTSFYSGSMGGDEIDEISIGDANNSVASQEQIVESAVCAPLSDSYPSNTGENSTGTASTLRLPHSHESKYAHNIYPNSQMPNGRLMHLRWHCWQQRTSSTAEFSSFPSWHASRVNVVSSPIAQAEEEGGHDEIDEFLMLPPAAPRLIVRREKNDVGELLRSRALFSKAARRSLGSVFNPGGVLTIRPITALNLPENFTSMFVKLRNGNIVQSTVSVDSKVAPVWSDDDEHLYFSHVQKKKIKRELVTMRNSTSGGVVDDSNDLAEIFNPTRASGSRGNDLNIQVEPFETSKSLRLMVIGESPLQVNVEIGVLEIPLGAALECCSQSLEDYEEDRKKAKPKGLLPAYIRWFPLMPPSECVPIEGDMGANSRPLETEKIHDNMFADYFSPCIKLAMVFQPNSVEIESDNVAPAPRPSTSQYLYFRLDRISAALIDSSRSMELVSFTLREADVRFSITTAKTRLAVAIGDIQVDQQNYGLNTKVPVILSPSPVKYPQPTVQFLAWKDNIRSTCDVDSYEYIALQVQEMDLKMEESLLFDLWELYLNIRKIREVKASLWRQNDGATFSATPFQVEQSSDEVEKAISFLKSDNKSKTKKIYVRELILGFFKINVSYFKSPPRDLGDSENSDDSLLDLDHLTLFPSPITSPDNPTGGQCSPVDDAFIRWSENSAIGEDESSQHASINIIAAVFPSISKAPIRFQERVIYHVFESDVDIWKSLKSFYSAEALRQIYKIVGSLDVVGNPTQVITSFRSGLRDFFLQPSRELKHITRNPSRVGVGVLKGTLSLVSNSASGIFGFASNLGATVGHTAALLTLDEQYQRLHSEQKVAQQRHYERWKKKGFGHITLMVSRPVHDIVLGVLSASTGLLTEPYRGAKKDGITGAIKGTAIGVIGVVVKPIVGLSDAFAHVMESIDDIAKSLNLLELKFKPVERYRLPYVFGFKRMLLPFSEVDSRSAQLLLAYPPEKKARLSEEYIVAAEVLHDGNGIERYVVVSTIRVALFRLRVVDGQGFFTTTLVWQIWFGKCNRITCTVGSKGHNGCFLCISRYDSRSDVPDEIPQTNNEQDLLRNDAFFADDESDHHIPETPRSFQPLGSLVPSLKLSNLWPNAINEGYVVTRYVVEGDFKHRWKLTRIHNAICCIFGDFGSVINERNRIDSTEGITSFGPLHFERQSEIPPQKNSRDLDMFYESLESTMWKCGGQIIPCHLPGTFNQSLPHGRSWIVDSRARTMFTGTPARYLPSEGDRADDVISPLSSEPNIRQTVVDGAKKAVEAQSCANEFQMIKHEWAKNDQFNDEFSFDGSLPSIVDEMNCFDDAHLAQGQDSFEVESCSVETFDASSLVVNSNSGNPRSTSHAVDTADSDKSIMSQLVPEDLNTSDAGNAPTAAVSGSSLDERLRRVECMLERLLGNDGSSANMSNVARLNSSLTDSPFTQPLYDVEALMKVIDDLKQQHSASKDSDASTNRSLNNFD